MLGSWCRWSVIVTATRSDSYWIDLVGKIWSMRNWCCFCCSSTHEIVCNSFFLNLFLKTIVKLPTGWRVTVGEKNLLMTLLFKLTFIFTYLNILIFYWPIGLIIFWLPVLYVSCLEVTQGNRKMLAGVKEFFCFSPLLLLRVSSAWTGLWQLQRPRLLRECKSIPS